MGQVVIRCHRAGIMRLATRGRKNGLLERASESKLKGVHAFFPAHPDSCKHTSLSQKNSSVPEAKGRWCAVKVMRFHTPLSTEKSSSLDQGVEDSRCSNRPHRCPWLLISFFK